MIGRPVWLRRARSRAVHLLDVRRHARLVRRALDERRLDVGALDAVLDLVDVDLRDLVLAAAHQRLRQVVVGVDARGEDHLQAALVGHALAEARVAVEEHRARLDDRAHAVPLDRVGVADRGLPLGLLVVEVRELEAHRLVGGAEVLVDQREPELVELDGPVDALDRCQRGRARRTERDRRARWRERR